MRNIDENVIKAQNDDAYLENFIDEYENFILHTAHKGTGQYITKRDDQWSVSLSAFNEAIKDYDYSKGSFLAFAEMVIRRRLFDYMRKQAKYSSEISIDSYSLENEEDDDSAGVSIKLEVMKKMASNKEDDAKLEIEALSGVLREYGFSFFDLIKVSPKAEKTRTVCAKAIVFLNKNPILLNEMRNTKNLPLKQIEKNASLPRKILERHRKYIMAGAEIITGDYPILSGYLSFVRKEILR